MHQRRRCKSTTTKLFITTQVNDKQNKLPSPVITLNWSSTSEQLKSMNILPCCKRESMTERTAEWSAADDEAHLHYSCTISKRDSLEDDRSKPMPHIDISVHLGNKCNTHCLVSNVQTDETIDLWDDQPSLPRYANIASWTQTVI
jgi:hypothetical protein